MYQRPITLDTS